MSFWRSCPSGIAAEDAGCFGTWERPEVAHLTWSLRRSTLARMSEIPDPEDRIIRRILIAVPTVLALGFLATVVLVTVMISYNFNILDWLE